MSMTNKNIGFESSRKVLILAQKANQFQLKQIKDPSFDHCMSEVKRYGHKRE